MLLKKVVSLIIGLAILALAIFVLLQLSQHPKMTKLRADLKGKTGILLDNLSETIPPSRKHPLTTIELEERLKANLPVPFEKFNEEDWEWFWHLLYGRYTEDLQVWPKRKRQLTRQEIQNILADNYKPFDRFSEQQWNIFWQHVLKGKVFKG